MNDQRVKTDNESAIAEFMGWERYSQNSFKCPNTYPIHNNTSNGWTTFSADQLEFGSRWDWLMPACQKWDNLFKSDPLLKERLTDTYSEYLRLCQLLQNSVTQFEIDPVYKQLVKNIHWYQKQKSS